MLKKAGYTDEEVQKILEEASLFFPEEAEMRLRELAKKEVYSLLIKGYLEEGTTADWISNILSLNKEEFLAYKKGTDL